MIRANKATIFGIAIFLVILFIGIGYAFLSSNLSINTSVSVPKYNYVCKRATKLHTKLCYFLGETDNEEGCLEKYNEGDTITYGSLGSQGTLAAGDAFDCDVNGDGKFDSNTERFYYVSDLDANNDYGVLIYYNNLTREDPDDDFAQYDSAGKPRENGPVTLLPLLPTTTQWKNVSLYNTTRKIKDENGTEYLDFSYEGYAARLLTLSEAGKTCGINNPSTDNLDLSNCQHLLENTAFEFLRTWHWYFLETIKSGEDTNTVYEIIPVKGIYMHNWGTVAATRIRTVRPVIEVPKSKISY